MRYILFFILGIGSASAQTIDPHKAPHDEGLYDWSCCNLRDCKPVPDGTLKDTQAGLMVEGFGVMSYMDPRLRRSRDDRDHLCVNSGKLVCAYQRPKGF